MRSAITLALRPLSASAALKKSPRWASALLVVCGGGVLLYVVLYANVVEQVLALLPPGATRADKDLVAAELHGEVILRSAFLALRIILGCTTFALLLTTLCRSVTTMIPFRFSHIFAAVVGAEIVLLAGKSVATVGAISGMDLPFWLSPSVIQSGSGALSNVALKSHLHVFTLWYAATLTCAVHILCEFRWLKAAVVVSLALLSWAAFDMSVLGIIRNAYSLLP